MPDLLHTLHGGSILVGTASALYALTITATALTSVLARSQERRRDARATLEVLLRR